MAMEDDVPPDDVPPKKLPEPSKPPHPLAGERPARQLT